MQKTCSGKCLGRGKSSQNYVVRLNPRGESLLWWDFLAFEYILIYCHQAGQKVFLWYQIHVNSSLTILPEKVLEIPKWLTQDIRHNRHLSVLSLVSMNNTIKPLCYRKTHFTFVKPATCWRWRSSSLLLLISCSIFLPQCTGMCKIFFVSIWINLSKSFFLPAAPASWISIVLAVFLANKRSDFISWRWFRIADCGIRCAVE